MTPLFLTRKAEAARIARAQRQADPRLDAAMRQRAEQCFVGAAMAFGESRPVPQLRALGRRANSRLLEQATLWDHPELWSELEIEGREHLDEALAAGAGAIVVPAHFGRYRWVPPTLLMAGYRVTLLVDSPNFGQVQQDAARGDWPERYPGLDWDRFACVTRDSPTALWELRGALKAGRLVHLFADGNSGQDGRPPDAHCLHLPFFGHTIAVRMGIGALAANSGAAVVPVFCAERGRLPPVMRFEPALRREPGEPVRAARDRIMTALFARLEAQVRETPHRWEEWSTFPSWIVAPAEAPPAPIGPLPASLPALAGRRLALAPGVVLARFPDGLRAFHPRSGTRYDAPALVQAAEARRPALAWVREQPEPETAFQVLRDQLARGWLALLR